MSAAEGQVLWLYGPPSVGKSATAWALYAHLLSGEPRGYFDIDQVGMCYPEPDDDPGRYALKARAATALVRRLTHAGARSVIISGVLDEGSSRDLLEELGAFGVTFCRLRVEPEELRRRLQSRYGPDEAGWCSTVHWPNRPTWRQQPSGRGHRHRRPGACGGGPAGHDSDRRKRSRALTTPDGRGDVRSGTATGRA